MKLAAKYCCSFTPTAPCCQAHWTEFARCSRPPKIIGGNFRLVFDGDTFFSRWLTRFYARLRSIGLYYGDPGIFVRRSVYEALGGFRPIPLMEDLDFVRRLERFGRTCCIADPPLITSSRRFDRRYPLEIFLGWVRLHVLFWLGASPDWLAELYKTHSPPPQTSQERAHGTMLNGRQ